MLNLILCIMSLTVIKMDGQCENNGKIADSMAYCDAPPDSSTGMELPEGTFRRRLRECNEATCCVMPIKCGKWHNKNSGMCEMQQQINSDPKVVCMDQMFCATDCCIDGDSSGL